jgi:transcriptional regulator with XRE-family HTH domain
MTTPSDQPELPLDELARRVRGARAYAGLSIPQLAERLGVGAQTVKRIESGRRAPRSYELWAIADICGVPRGLFELDFEDLSRANGGLAAVLGEVNRRLGRLERRLERSAA